MASMTELREAVEIALEHVSDAIEALKGYDDLDSHLGALEDISYELNRDKEHYETNERVMHEEAMAEAIRDYHRGLI